MPRLQRMKTVMWSLDQNLVYNNCSVNVKHCCCYTWSTGEQTDIQGVCVHARSCVHTHSQHYPVKATRFSWFFGPTENPWPTVM